MIFDSCDDSPFGVERRFITLFFIKTNIRGRSKLRNCTRGGFAEKQSVAGGYRKFVWDTKGAKTIREEGKIIGKNEHQPFSWTCLSLNC